MYLHRHNVSLNQILMYEHLCITKFEQILFLPVHVYQLLKYIDMHQFAAEPTRFMSSYTTVWMG